MALQPIYQFYAELTDYKPKIWRRFQVLGNITMAHLGYILMTLFEMQASHLFCFDVPVLEPLKPDSIDKPKKSKPSEEQGEQWIYRYEILYEDDPIYYQNNRRGFDATKVKMKDVFREPEQKATFIYDYGDYWQVDLILEKIIMDKEISRKDLPRVLEGQGYGIIEDCGGPYGLAQLAKAFKQKKGSEYQDMREWLGIDDLDLKSFDMDDMNFRLKRIPRIYRDIYEYNQSPSPYSINLLERRYLKKKE